MQSDFRCTLQRKQRHEETAASVACLQCRHKSERRSCIVAISSPSVDRAPVVSFLQDGADGLQPYRTVKATHFASQADQEPTGTHTSVARSTRLKSAKGGETNIKSAAGENLRSQFLLIKHACHTIVVHSSPPGLTA